MRIPLLTSVLLLTLTLGQAPESTPGKNCIGRANKANVSAYVVLLRLRWDLYAKWKQTGVWPDDAEANKALEGHSGHWMQQRKQGRAIFAANKFAQNAVVCSEGEPWHPRKKRRRSLEFY